MEPHEVNSMVRHLVAIAAHQNIINERLVVAIERLDTAIERLPTTLATIKDLLERGQNGS